MAVGVPGAYAGGAEPEKREGWGDQCDVSRVGLHGGLRTRRAHTVRPSRYSLSRATARSPKILCRVAPLLAPLQTFARSAVGKPWLEMTAARQRLNGQIRIYFLGDASSRKIADTSVFKDELHLFACHLRTQNRCLTNRNYRLTSADISPDGMTAQSRGVGTEDFRTPMYIKGERRHLRD